MEAISVTVSDPSDSIPAARRAGESVAGEPEPPVVIDALARLLSVASIYPPDHPRIAAIVEPVLRAVRADSGPGRRFAMNVAEAAADAKPGSGAARLRRELETLGIARIEVDREVSVADLVRFARFLRHHVANQSGEGGFRHLDFDMLPWTVHVLERQFGTPTFSGSEAPSDPETASGTSGRLVRPQTPHDVSSLSDELLALVRGCVRAAVENRTADAMSAVASWDARGDNEMAIAETVRAWVEASTRGALFTRTSAEILADASRTLPQMLPGVSWEPVLDGIRAVIGEHLHEGFRAEGRAEFDRKTPVNAESAEKCAPVATLERSIRDYVEGATTLVVGGGVDRAEQISILFHLMPEAEAEKQGESVMRHLGPCLGDDLGPRERAVVVGWLRSTATASAAPEVDVRVTPVLGAARSSGRGVVAALLIDACEPPHEGLAGPLWPHLAHELLTQDGAGDPVRRRRLEELVARVAPSRLREESARLGALVSRGTASAALEMPAPRRELYPLYEVLLAAPRESGLPAMVTQAFLRHAEEHPVAGALVVLRTDDDRAHRLVARLVREGEPPSAGLRNLAVGTIVVALRQLPRRRRREKWVAPAMHALSRLPCAESVSMLREVIRDRRLIVVPEWPAEVRRAAAAAMGVREGARLPGRSA